MGSQGMGLSSTVSSWYLLSNSQAHITNFYLTVPALDIQLEQRMNGAPPRARNWHQLPCGSNYFCLFCTHKRKYSWQKYTLNCTTSYRPSMLFTQLKSCLYNLVLFLPLSSHSTLTPFSKSKQQMLRTKFSPITPALKPFSGLHSQSLSISSNNKLWNHQPQPFHLLENLYTMSFMWPPGCLPLLTCLKLFLKRPSLMQCPSGAQRPAQLHATKPS